MPLYIPLTTFKQKFHTITYTAHFHSLGDKQNSLTDLLSLLSFLSQTFVDTENLKNTMKLLSSTENDDADLNKVSSTVQTFAHRTLLLALSEISSPFVTALLFLLQVLSFVWAMAHSIKFFKNYVLPCLRKTKLKILSKSRIPSSSNLPNKDDDQPSTTSGSTRNPFSFSRNRNNHENDSPFKCNKFDKTYTL